MNNSHNKWISSRGPATREEAVPDDPGNRDAPEARPLLMPVVLDLVELVGPRIRLSPVSQDEAQTVLTGGVLPGRPSAPDFPHADTADGLRMSLQHGLPPGWWVIAQGVVVGDCGLHGPVTDDGKVEIGYGLAVSARGNGYGRELGQLLVSWLRQQPAVQRVEANGVLADNTPSRRVLEAAGLRPTKHHGATVDYST